MNGETTMRNGACRGFTLVELLVVIAMLMLLMGSVTSAIMTAQRRAKISKATVEVKEMTNAILAFENYSSRGDLSAQASGSWQEATEASLAFILGKVTGQNGERVPVLYNAAIRNGRILDPWGHPYYVKIKQGKVTIQNNGSNGSLSSTQTAVAFPNFYRRQAEEN